VPANSRKFAIQQIAHQIVKPILIRAAIRVRERDDFSRRRGDARVPRHGQAEVLLVAERAHLRMRRRDLRGVIG